jgi:hypothetical protein
MLKEQELSKGIELAEKGYFKKENIEAIIKADFQNEYHSCESLMKLYEKLSKKYGKSVSTIMNITK